jgi:radical SAM-linked protein
MGDTRRPDAIGGRLARVNEQSDPPIGRVDTPPAVLREAVQRWRLVLARDAVGGDGQRELAGAWEAALTASGLPLAGMDGPRPRPRFLPAAPLAGSIPGEAELVDIWLVERLPAWRVREALAAHLPPGHRLLDAYDVWLGEASLPGRVTASVYRVEVGVPPAELASACAVLLAAPSIMRERRKGETVVTYDLRPFIDDLTVEDAPAPGGTSTLRMTLRHDPEKGIGRPEETLAAISGVIGVEVSRTGLVRESLVVADPAPPPPPPRRGPKPPRR